MGFCRYLRGEHMNRLTMILCSTLLPSMSFGSDWRVELDVALSELAADQVASYEEVRPTMTAKGHLRFLDPTLANRDAVPWLVARVADVYTRPEYRRAYAGAVVRLLAGQGDARAWNEAWVDLATTVGEPSVRHTLVAGFSKADTEREFGEKEYLRFNDLTMVPIQKKLNGTSPLMYPT